MAKNNNLTDFLTDVANAIREKKGTSDPINPQDFSAEIASIETGGGGTQDTPIIGDGKTYLYIKIAERGRMTVPLRFSQTVANGVVIDWGDGSPTETLSGTGNLSTSHTYAEVGKYTISLNPSSGCTLGLGNKTSSYCVIGSQTNTGFVYCNMLQAVEIGKNVTIIDAYAFARCYSLTSVVIPEGITSIGNYAFYNCYSLASVVIPEGVTRIGNYAFVGCNSLKSVAIPKSVTNLGSEAFNACYSLASVDISEGITSIGNNTFSSCYSLASVDISEGVTRIEGYAFYNCYSLASITFPKSITSIKYSAFGACAGMAYYDFSQCTSIPSLGGTSAFDNIPSDCKIVVPDSLYDSWIAATNWSNFASYIIKTSEHNPKS